MKKLTTTLLIASFALCASFAYAEDNQAPEGREAAQADGNDFVSKKAGLEDTHVQSGTDLVGYVSLFDGKTLTNWEGDPTFWSVKDGCITGVSTPDHKVPYSMHIAWTGEPASDFELLIDFKLTNGNSGVMYRAAKDPRRQWGLMGYQADMDSNNSYTGIMYGEEIGGILTGRGQKCKIGTDRKAVVLEQFATSADLAKKINFEDWNTYRIVVKGNVMTHYINGVMMSQTIEEDPSQLKSGTFGMQIHPGPPMTVQFKNIYLKKL